MHFYFKFQNFILDKSLKLSYFSLLRTNAHAQAQKVESHLTGGHLRLKEEPIQIKLDALLA